MVLGGCQREEVNVGCWKARESSKGLSTSSLDFKATLSLTDSGARPPFGSSDRRDTQYMCGAELRTRKYQNYAKS